MKKDIRVVINIVWLLVGLVLIGLSIAEQVDAFWSGMGSALALIGALRLLRYYRFNKDPEYKEKLEIEAADERNRFLRSTAWAWAGYLFILIAAISVIGFKLAGEELLMMAASSAVCLLLVLYWVCYLVLKQKY